MGDKLITLDSISNNHQDEFECEFVWEDDTLTRKEIEQLGLWKDVEILEENNILKRLTDNRYTFNFVGIIETTSPSDEELIIVMPKYTNKARFSKKQNIQHMSKILKALKKYKDDEKTVELQQDIFLPSRIGTANRLALADFFIRDYLERGIYRENKIIFSTNSNGRIDWKRTIQQYTPISSNNSFFYPNTVTKKQIVREHEIISDFHKFVIRYSISRFGKLLGFDFGPDIVPVPKNVVAFKKAMIKGKNSHIYYSLIKELRNRFGSRDIQLLRNLVNFLEPKYSSNSEKLIVGIRNFHNLWERMIGDIFDPRTKYSMTDEVNKKFREPQWLDLDLTKIHETGRGKPIPETVCRVVNDNSKIMVIDSKYYNLDYDEINNKFSGKGPSVNDIIKQIAYEEIIKSHYPDSKIVNCLIFPTNSNQHENKFIRPFSTVYIPGVETKAHIINCLVSPTLAIENYINDVVLTPQEKLELFTSCNSFEQKSRQHLEK